MGAHDRERRRRRPRRRARRRPPTYYAADVAYHYDKLQRADRVIDILGPDHHGYIARLNALADAYGRSGAIEVILAQQITLKRGDEIISMSKRAGNIVTLEEILDEVGVDAARFFFVMLSTDQPLTFDLALAKEQSNDNPVFYVQYGHARIASLIRRARERDASLVAEAGPGAPLERLDGETEVALMRRLAEFGSVVDGAARARATASPAQIRTRHRGRLPRVLRQVAGVAGRRRGSRPRRGSTRAGDRGANRARANAHLVRRKRARTDGARRRRSQVAASR